MATLDLFWQTYLQLEKELIEMSNLILMDDKQMDVYSLRIADLIIRTNTEIEAIAKELHKTNGGPSPANPPHLMYDTDCLCYLDKIWTLSKKIVMVVNPMFCLVRPENISFKPLKEAHKMGTDGPKWKSAYQAVKHDRANSIDRATVKNLLHALGALFILNIYHKGYSEIFQNIMEAQDISTTCGSNLFAVKLFNEGSYDLSHLKANGQDVKDAVLMLHPIEDDVKEMRKADDAYREAFLKRTIERINSDYAFNQKISSSSDPIKATQEIISQEIARNLSSDFKSYGREFQKAIMKVRYIVELNKNQFAATHQHN